MTFQPQALQTKASPCRPISPPHQRQSGSVAVGLRYQLAASPGPIRFGSVSGGRLRLVSVIGSIVRA